MAIQVIYYPEISSVSIDGIVYTKNTLEEKVKTKIEKSILTTLIFCINVLNEPGDEDIDGDGDEIYRLVQSDMFKKDNHSMALINKDKFLFWEQQG